MALRTMILALLLLSSFATYSMHQVYLYTNAGNLCAFVAGSSLMTTLKLGNTNQAAASLLFGTMGSTFGACTMLSCAANAASQFGLSKYPSCMLMSSSILSGLAGFFSTALVTWYFDWHQKQKD